MSNLFWTTSCAPKSKEQESANHPDEMDWQIVINQINVVKL